MVSTVRVCPSSTFTAAFFPRTPARQCSERSAGAMGRLIRHSSSHRQRACRRAVGATTAPSAPCLGGEEQLSILQRECQRQKPLGVHQDVPGESCMKQPREALSSRIADFRQLEAALDCCVRRYPIPVPSTCSVANQDLGFRNPFVPRHATAQGTLGAKRPTGFASAHVRLWLWREARSIG